MLSTASTNRYKLVPSKTSISAESWSPVETHYVFGKIVFLLFKYAEYISRLLSNFAEFHKICLLSRFKLRLVVDCIVAWKLAIYP